MKQTIFVSALFLALCALISCGGDTTTDSAQTTAVSIDTTAAETAAPDPVLSVPQKDYAGETVTILTLEDYNGRFRLDVEADGEAINASPIPTRTVIPCLS